MIVKILITLAVIIAALLFLRYKNASRRQLQQAQQAQQAVERRRAVVIAGLLVVLTLLLSGGLYIWHWQQDHRLFSVRVVNSHTGAEQHYQVYQAEIHGRSFRTIDGRLILLSDVERMEVVESSAPDTR